MNGGARKTRKASKKARESGNLRAKSHKVNHPTFMYKSEHITFTSHPEKGEPHGMRTVVTVKNGKGAKEIYRLNKAGKTLKHNSKQLKGKEIKEITQGNYVPGLFQGL